MREFENEMIQENDCMDEQREKNYEADSCPKAWEHYKIVYDNRLENYNFEQLSFYNNWKNVGELKSGLYSTNNKLWLNYVDLPIKGKRNRLFLLENSTKKEMHNKITYIEATYRYGGECDFNFNEKKCELFREIIGNDVYANKRLEACKKKHHTLINFSLIQAMGNMQGFKGANRFDRPDVFINKLDQHFRGVSNDVVCFASEANRPYLINYLNGFKDIYNYCATLYFIDDIKFIDEIIKQGALSIENCEDVIRYMNLADEFWNRKLLKFKKLYENSAV